MAKKKRKVARKRRPVAKAPALQKDTTPQSEEETPAGEDAPSEQEKSTVEAADADANAEVVDEEEAEEREFGTVGSSESIDEKPAIEKPAVDQEGEPSAEESEEEGLESDKQAFLDELNGPDAAIDDEGELSEDDHTSRGAGLVGEGVDFDESEVEDTEHYLKGLVEALIFSADKPQSSREIARAARLDKGRVQELIEQLLLETKDRGMRLVEVSEGYAFRTNPAYSSYVREFLAQRPVRLSRAQLETLAIVAYRQPITRPEVDDIRGVDSGAVIKLLLERELIRILGKKDEPGRPMIYGTAPAFLDLFSLNSLRDLPTLREFTELSEDSRAKFEMEIGEPAPEGPINFSEEEEAPESSSAAPEEGGQYDGTVPEGQVPDDEGDSGQNESGSEEDSESENSEEDVDGDEGVDPQEKDSEEDADVDGDEGTEGEDVVPVNAADEEEFPDDEDDDEDEDDDDDDDED